MLRQRPLLAFLVPSILLVVTACGKDGDQKATASGGTTAHCARYADMEIKCDPESADEAARPVIESFCAASKKNKDTDVMAALIALESDCAQTTTECVAYAACIEKKKDETDPPGM